MDSYSAFDSTKVVRPVNIGFLLYLVFTISFLLHLPARVQWLGAIRFDLLLVLIILFWIPWQRRGGEPRPSDGISRILIILFIYTLISIPFVQWPGTVLKNGLPDLIKAVVFYFYSVSLINSERKLRIYIVIFLLCQSIRIVEPLYLHEIYGYWGSSTYIGEGEMMDRLAGGPYDVINPNGLAFVIASVIPFWHYVGLSSSLRYKTLYFLAAPIFLYALLLTASRTGILALVVIMISIYIKSRYKIVVAVIVGISFMIGVATLTGIQKERYLSIWRTDVRGASTSAGRIAGVTDGFRLAMKRPIFGYGLGTSEEATFHATGRAQPVHNLYVEVLQELGIVGLVIFLVFLKKSVSNLVITRHQAGGINSGKLRPILDGLEVWFAVNILFSFASYGLTSYEWYLLAGLSGVIRRITGETVDVGILHQPVCHECTNDKWTADQHR